MDYGLFADSGETEYDICLAYARKLVGVATEKKHYPKIIVAKTLTARISYAVKLKPDVVISFHMDGDAGAQPGGRVLYAVAGAERAAEAVGNGLGWPVQRVEACGLLR